MIFDAVQGLADLSGPGISHGTDQSIALRDFIVVRFEQIDGL